MKFREPVEDYLAKKGFAFDVSGKELILKVCPYCRDEGKHGKRGHFYMQSTTGLFYCHKCGESGGLFKLKRDMGDFIEPQRIVKKEVKTIPDSRVAELHQNFVSNREQLLAFSKRGFIIRDTEAEEIPEQIEETPETDDKKKKPKAEKKKTIKLNWGLIRHFKVGFDSKTGEIAFPFFRQGKCINIKYRTPDKNFRLEKDHDKCAYNIDNVDLSQPLIIVEGEYDAMAAWHYGLVNVVSVPNGSKSWKFIVDDVKTAVDIIVALDNDKDGNDAAEEMTAELGVHKCKRLILPYKDFNDCLIAGMPKRDIEQMIESLQAQPHPSIETFKDSLENMYRQAKENPLTVHKTYYTEMNALLGGGILENHLTILTADTGIGKSTFSLNVLHEIEADKTGSLIISAEQSNSDIVKILLAINSGKCIESGFISEETTLTPEDVKNAITYYDNVLLWHGEEPPALWQLQDLIQYCYHHFGTRFFLLDHLHQFIHGDDPDHERLSIEKLMRGLNVIAKNMPVHIWMICHPSKDTGKKPERIYMNDLKGSAAIKQYAWNVISLARDREAGQTKIEMWLQKKRYPLAEEGFCYFEFERTSLRYRQISKEEYHNGNQSDTH